MTGATRRTDCNSEPWLYLAFELGEKSWKLGFSNGLGQKPRFRQVSARNVKALGKEIEAAKRRFGLWSEAKVASCYEAGRDGFWLHRYLQAAGVSNVVVDSASIEVNRRARRAKTDRLDAGKLLVMLMRYQLGEKKVWSVARVPSVEVEDGRQLHREIKSLQRERIRAGNRIKGLLATQGLEVRRWEGFDRQLEQMRLVDGSGLPGGLKSRLVRQWEQKQLIEAQLRVLEKERRRLLKEEQGVALEQIRRLVMLRGIGPVAAWMLVWEFYGWRQFRNRREVGCLSGLVPTPHQSGQLSRERGISKAGNRYVRGLAVELAWLWLRYQPNSGLARWYQERFGSGGGRAKRIGIVAVARRLLIDLWRYLDGGVLPEGAELKA